MLRRILQLPLILSALFSVSCTQAPAPDTRAADEAAIRAQDEQWSATAGKNDLDGTLAFYADDAVLLPPNAPIASDPKSIRAAWAGMLGPNSAVSWKVSKAEASKAGDIAYIYGTYQLSIKDPKGGPGVNDAGKMVEIWKKQPDGKWKCAVDIFNSDLPLPAPPAKKA